MERQIGPIRVISSTKELRKIFRYWADRIYDLMGIDGQTRQKAISEIGKLVSYKWHVVEIAPNVFFETYVLSNWGHAFGDDTIREAWAGTCFGMKDHFSVLYNGDVTLCCIDFDGHTAIGNVHAATFDEILSSDELGEIITGFKRYRLVHPYCRICQGSHSFLSWLMKPLSSVIALQVLKPFFYHKTRVFDKTEKV